MFFLVAKVYAFWIMLLSGRINWIVWFCMSSLKMLRKALPFLMSLSSVSCFQIAFVTS